MLEQIFTLTFFTAFLAATVGMAVPLIYATLGEVFLEKTGILNIGLEGVMLGGAFGSLAGAFCSNSLLVGFLCGMLGGCLVSVIHGFLCIKLFQDQSVSGIALNIFMLGVTSFGYKLMSAGESYQQIETLKRIRIPVLSKIPLIGDAFFNQDIMTYLVFVLVILASVFYRKTSSGLAFSSIGENHQSADAAGISVYGHQWVAGAAFVFGGANALQIRLQAMGVPLPTQALAMLPYVITLLTLLLSIGKSNQPEKLGKPYIRGSR